MGCCPGQVPIQPPPPSSPLTPREAELRDKLHELQRRANDLRSDVIRNPCKHCLPCLEKLHDRIDHILNRLNVFTTKMEDSYERYKEKSLLPSDPEPFRDSPRDDQGGAGAGTQQPH